MSWTVVASASSTYALANRNDYVEVDYLVDFYVDDDAWTVGSAAVNTWTESQ